MVSTFLWVGCLWEGVPVSRCGLCTGDCYLPSVFGGEPVSDILWQMRPKRSEIINGLQVTFSVQARLNHGLCGKLTRGICERFRASVVHHGRRKIAVLTPEKLMHFNPVSRMT